MLALSIPDTRDFMKKLLMEDVFDSFLVSEASVTTFTQFRIDGSWHPDFFDDDEEKKSALSWSVLRPVFFGIIKGKHTPDSFRIIFRLADHNLVSLLSRSGLELRPEDVDGLFLNVSFSKGKVSCTSGTSLKLFTLDKRLEQLWDDMLQKFFRTRKIPYTAL